MVSPNTRRLHNDESTDETSGNPSASADGLSPRQSLAQKVDAVVEFVDLLLFSRGKYCIIFLAASGPA
jgi:hypothetical protein